MSPSPGQRLAMRAGKLWMLSTGVPGLDRVRGRSLSRALTDKTTLVTGASSGIGRATALKVGAAGGTVLLVARTEDRLAEVAEEIEAHGGTAHVYPCDLYDLDAIDRMADEVLANHGHVDILVNNAGHSIRRSIARSYDRIHDYERTMRLNYLAGVKLILRFLPLMRERGRGHILNVSTMGTQVRAPRYSAYIASKTALDAFSSCIAAEVLHDNVRITTVHMPLVRTPMSAPTKAYEGMPSLSAEEAGDMVARAIVNRPRRVGTIVGGMAEVGRSIAPNAHEAFLNRAYRFTRGPGPPREVEEPAENEPDEEEAGPVSP